MPSGHPDAEPLTKTYVLMHQQRAHRSFDVLTLREIVDTLVESHLALLRDREAAVVRASKPVAPAPNVRGPGRVLKVGKLVSTEGRVVTQK